jgi:hypothetical protein
MSFRCFHTDVAPGMGIRHALVHTPYGVFGMGYEYKYQAYGLPLQFYFRHNGAVLQYIPNHSRLLPVVP